MKKNIILTLSVLAFFGIIYFIYPKIVASEVRNILKYQLLSDEYDNFLKNKMTKETYFKYDNYFGFTKNDIISRKAKVYYDVYFSGPPEPWRHLFKFNEATITYIYDYRIVGKTNTGEENRGITQRERTVYLKRIGLNWKIVDWHEESY